MLLDFTVCLCVCVCSGLYRFAHARIREFTESVVFFRGQENEAERADHLIYLVYHAKVKALLAGVTTIFFGNLQGVMNTIMPIVIVSWAVFFYPAASANADNANQIMAFFLAFAVCLGTYGASVATTASTMGTIRRVARLLEV